MARGENCHAHSRGPRNALSEGLSRFQVQRSASVEGPVTRTSLRSIEIFNDDGIINTMSLPEFINRQPPWLVIFEASGFASFIGWIDYVTGWEWSFFVFYAAPIVVVTSRLGQRVGFPFAIFSAVIWWLAQLENNPYHSRWGFALAVFSRFFYFVVLVIAVAAVAARHEVDRARIESLERAQQLEQEILRTSEREQQRIGQDLHDSLGPHLAAIGYAVTFLENVLRERGQPEVTKTEQIRGMVSEALSLTRGMARGISPVQMDSGGLAMALEDLASTVSGLTGMSVSFWETGNPFVADPEVGLHLYRIAQEALNNAAKHGEAKNVSISLSNNDGSTRLMVSDDGKGMSKCASATRGLGLQSMRYRARALQGELKIESIPHEGTVVVCELRVPPAEPAAPIL
jgi:signal transduction histidine kinase